MASRTSEHRIRPIHHAAMRTSRPDVPPSGGRPVRSRWLLSWPGLAVLGVANGITRELVYTDALGEQRAHQVSTVTLVMLIVALTWYLQRRWPLTSTQDAVVIGVAWAVLTVVFEFAFGRYVDGASWSELLAAYKMWNGELWPLVLVVMGAAPTLVRMLSHRRDSE
ncbi:MAG: hypothetical protein ACRDO2_02785 [Nocardioidaceae bacterium]